MSVDLNENVEQSNWEATEVSYLLFEKKNRASIDRRFIRNDTSAELFQQKISIFLTDIRDIGVKPLKNNVRVITRCIAMALLYLYATKHK